MNIREPKGMNKNDSSSITHKCYKLETIHSPTTERINTFWSIIWYIICGDFFNSQKFFDTHPIRHEVYVFYPWHQASLCLFQPRESSGSDVMCLLRISHFQEASSVIPEISCEKPRASWRICNEGRATFKATTAGDKMWVLFPKLKRKHMHWRNYTTNLSPHLQCPI